MKNVEHQVELWDIDRIKPYPKNVKIHTDEQIEKLSKAIKRLGWTQPIIVDRDGVIIAGHGRRLAALHLGMQKVPIICRSDLTPEEADAARISDNRIAQGDIDEKMLAEEIQRLFHSDFDLSVIGFDDDELKRLMPSIEIDLQQTESLIEAVPTPSTSPGPIEVREQAYKPTFQIIVELPNETDQELLYNRLAGEGFQCRVLSM